MDPSRRCTPLGGLRDGDRWHSNRLSYATAHFRCITCTSRAPRKLALKCPERRKARRSRRPALETSLRIDLSLVLRFLSLRAGVKSEMTGIEAKTSTQLKSCFKAKVTRNCVTLSELFSLWLLRVHVFQELHIWVFICLFVFPLPSPTNPMRLTLGA